VTLVDSGHLLGSAQTVVSLADGTLLGYSGDFSWPLERVIQCDYLVVDGTYGSSASTRKFAQGEAEEDLVQLVRLHIGRGRRVYIKVHPGTLQRVLGALCDRIPAPMLIGPRAASESLVYAAHGHVFGDLVVSDTVRTDRDRAGTAAYVRLLGPGEGGRSVVPSDAVFIVASGFRVTGDSPVVEHLEGRSYQIGLSDHADFEQTLTYVAETGAQRVLVDNSRGGNGEALAASVRYELQVGARADLSEPEDWL
jgi:Cft2 family RNA processing exonuclease